eukprot:2861589-Pleurochrysis_carterae.AAC.1
MSGQKATGAANPALKYLAKQVFTRGTPTTAPWVISIFNKTCFTDNSKSIPASEPRRDPDRHPPPSLAASKMKEL